MNTDLLFETLKRLRNESLETVLRLQRDDVPDIHATLSLYPSDMITSFYETCQQITQRSLSEQSHTRHSLGRPPTYYHPRSEPRPKITDLARYSFDTDCSKSSFDRQSQGSRISNLSSNRTSQTSLSSIQESHFEVPIGPNQTLSQYSISHLTGLEEQALYDYSAENNNLGADYSFNSSSSSDYRWERGAFVQKIFPEVLDREITYVAPPKMRLVDQDRYYSLRYPLVQVNASRDGIDSITAYPNTPQPHFVQSPMCTSPDGEVPVSAARTPGGPAKVRSKVWWCPYRGCTKTCSRKKDFQQHVLGAHEMSDSYFCAHDGILYRRISDLRSHHTTEHKACRVINKSECERHEPNQRKADWGCSLCGTLLFGADEWFMHHDYHVSTEKKEKADCDFSTLIHSLLSQKSIEVHWNARMKAIHPSLPVVRYEWDEETSHELLLALEWGKFRGGQLSTPDEIEELIDLAISTGVKVSTTRQGKRPASSSPGTLMRMMTKDSIISNPDFSEAPSYDNGI